MLVGSTGLVLSQTKIWERNAASGNFPTFMGTANTERGFATGTLVLQPYTRIWEKSSALGTLPSYMGTGNTERGFAYGKVGANERVLLVDRKAGNLIFVLNAATGDSVGRLDTTGLAAIASGTLAVNDAEISADGVTYVCNLTTNATTSAFKVYRWSSETATPQLALSYTGTAFRYGDKFTVTGSASDNSIVIWAAAASANKVIKFTTADNGATFTPTEITLSGTLSSGSAAVYPNNAGTEIYVKSNGTYLKRYQINGTLVDSVSGSIIGTGSNALRYFEVNSKKYLAVYTYGSGNENLRTIDITNGLSSAVLVGASPSMGSTSNGNGTGDVAFMMNTDNTVNVYVLGTNNGIGSYKLNPANFGTLERMYLVSRKAGNLVYFLNAATGDSLGRLDTTGLAAMASGTILINDAELSSDGVIYTCNLTTNASTSAFKVYRWKNESATPQLVVNYTGLALRFGDKFTVTGSTANSTVAIWAVAAGSNKVLKFTTADSGATFAPTEITLSGNGIGNGSGPSICPNTTSSEFFVKANGDYVKRYLANGTLVDSISGSVVGTGSNALRYFELNSKKYLAIFTYGSGNEFARIVDVSNGLSSAVSLATTPSLGTTPNGNGTGDVSLKMNGDGTVTVYVLSTNNGLGAYTYMPPTKVANPVFTPVAGTYNAPIWMKLSVGTLNAKIYYTLNGATPDSTSASKLFADSLKISDTLTTVKAIAYATGMQASDVVSAAYRIVIVVGPPVDSLYSVWAKTQSAGTFPLSFSTGNFERGMAYGKVGGKDRIYVLARTGGPRLVVYDALKGDSVAAIFPPASVTGGTFPLSFVDVSDDGIIFVGNMTLDVSTSSFKVYRWNSEADSGKAVIDYTNSALTGCRLGDIISVFGKASDNTLTIFAAASGKDRIVKFTTTDNGATFTAQVITLSNGSMGSVPNVARGSDGSLYVKSYGYQVYHYTAAGTLIDSVSSSVVGADVTDIKYFERLGKKFLICYYPNDGTPYTDERVTLVDITNPLSPVTVFASPSIGNKPNLNATGAVDYLMLADNSFLIFIMGTNNGLAAFTYKKSGSTDVESNVSLIPQLYSLDQNYPNPFNPATSIRFSLPTGARVSLKIYDILGQQVADIVQSQLPAGVHTAAFNAVGLSSGVYLYRLEATGLDGSRFTEVRKLVLVK